MAHDIYFDFYVNAPQNKVFETFVLPKHLDNWWTLKSSGTPKLHEPYNLNFTDTYDWYAKVSKIIDNEAFYLKMLDADKDWNPTSFGITLEQSNNNTLVKFSHTNWPKNNHHFRYSAFCWSQLLLGFKNYIEEGTIIPFNLRS